MKIISVVGARPQFIKLGPLSREIRKHYQEIIIHTGQHYDHDMSDLFFEQLEIPKADINLGIGSGTHGSQTAKMLDGLERQILESEPDFVVTFGDTNSTLAACLAASKTGVPSVHIEAGLRSFNRFMPEEINRVVADHTAELLFAPTTEAMRHLKREGLEQRSVLTGDIMVDSIAFVQEKISKNPFPNEDYLLLTLHRPYTVDNPVKLSEVFSSLGKLNQSIVFAIHPRTKKNIENYNISVPDNFRIIPPQGYIEFQGLLKNCQKVITDSGGLQKEAYISGKPCITLRPETEWVETVESGWNILLDCSDSQLAEKISDFSPSGEQENLYGNDVARKMVSEMERWFTT